MELVLTTNSSIIFFADNVVFMSAREINVMLQELNTRSKEVGHKINADKTKVMYCFGMPRVDLQGDGVDFVELDINVY